MRHRWQRHAPPLALDPAQVAALVATALPAAMVVRHRPLPGGLSNTNLVVDLAAPPRRVVLRLYQSDPPQAAKEAALATLLRRHGVPAARFLHVATDHPAIGRPFAVLDFVSGAPLEALAPRLDGAARGAVGRAIGRTLAAIHAIGFAAPGFLDAGLRVGEPIDFGGAGLRTWLAQCFAGGPGAARLGGALTEALLAFAAREGDRLDAWMQHPGLVHADFNASNILVAGDGARPRVAAVLDWEFAFSGSPAFDFGNLLRPPLGTGTGFAAAVADGYREGGGTLPADWRRIARIADLTAWAEFLTRRDVGEELAADARRIVRATIEGA